MAKVTKKLIRHFLISSGALLQINDRVFSQRRGSQCSTAEEMIQTRL
ncbi:unnamed protein product [Oikopleura dioica]|uniref:Uncharacterized protein n=1 Tax=Oikopleura dioica TaxID=34765 RepID=E4XPV3_OIKDI|nr:unnamed protein product [Oikopleura dioica]